MTSLTVKKRNQYPPEVLQKAQEAIMAGAGINKTARYFGIPRSTLAVRQADIQAKLKLYLGSQAQQAQTINVEELRRSFKKGKKHESGPKQRRKTYSRYRLFQALKAIEEGAPTQATSNYFGIPKSTLNKAKGKVKGKRKIFKDFDFSKYDSVSVSEPSVPSEPKQKQIKFEDNELSIEEINDPHDATSDTSSTAHPRIKYCCTCLAENPESMSTIDAETLNTLTAVLAKEVLDDLTLPDLEICAECVEKFNYVKNFLNTCSTSLVSFKNHLLGETDATQPAVAEIVIKSEIDLDEDYSNSVYQEESINAPVMDDAQSEMEDEEVESNSSDQEEQDDDETPYKTYLESKEGDFCSLCCTFYSGTEAEHNIEKHCNVDTEGGGVYGCLECHQTFVKESRFLQHINDSHIRFKAPVKCPYCDYLSIFKKVLFKHIENHSRDYVCSDCSARFNQKASLMRHIEANHMKERMCPICKEVVQAGEAYESHVAAHQNERHVCDGCGKSYKSEVTLSYHKRLACDTGAVTCNDCGKTYSNTRKLLYHQKVTHEEPTHLCTYCGKKYMYATVLRRHIVDTHEKEKLKPEACQFCGKVFKGNRLLHGHIKQVHGNRSWKCMQCDATFSTKARLQKHMYSHLKKRPFNCHLCQSGYYMMEYLRNHYERSHNMTMTNEEIHKSCIRVYVDQELIKKSD